MESDSSDSENCVLCGGDSGDLLVCSVVGCCIAVHESCMEFEPLIDKNGKFYCAHCAYLRSFRRTQKLKRKAMEAKEVLVRYIKSFRVGGDVNVGNGTIIRRSGGCGDRNVGEVEPNKGGVDNVGCVGVGGEEIEHMEMDTNVVNGNGGSYGGGGGRNGGGDRNVEGDIELSKGDEDEDSGVGNVRCVGEGRGVDGGRMQSVSAGVEMDANVGNGNLDGQRVSKMHEIDKSNKDDACDGFYQGDEDGNRVCDENEGKSQEEERMERGGEEVPVDTVAPDSGDFYLGSPLLRKKRVKQRAQRTVVVPYAVPLRMQPSPSGKSSPGQKDTLEGDADKQKEKAATSSSETKEIPESNRNGKETITSSKSREVPDLNQVPDLDQHEKITTSTETSKIPESASERLLEIDFKRRKHPWTAEEVNMLRKGVRAYAVQVKKNLPWRKILELGKDVFHKTRTPDNLKDKWKNMSKESSNKQET